MILPLVDVETGSRGPSVKNDAILRCATEEPLANVGDGR
jgi:hypothetical protein